MKEKRFGKILSTVLSFVLVFALAFSFVSPLTVEAKTKKLTPKTLSKENFEVGWTSKQAKTVKKGNYVITFNKKSGVNSAYLKFTAPKTKKYRFTASDLSSNSSGWFGLMQPYTSSKILGYKTVKTNKGKDYGLHFYSEDYRSLIHTRWGEMKLKKGETVYIRLTASSSSSKKVNFKFSIK